MIAKVAADVDQTTILFILAFVEYASTRTWLPLNTAVQAVRPVRPTGPLGLTAHLGTPSTVKDHRNAGRRGLKCSLEFIGVERSLERLLHLRAMLRPVLPALERPPRGPHLLHRLGPHLIHGMARNRVGRQQSQVLQPALLVPRELLRVRLAMALCPIHS